MVIGTKDTVGNKTDKGYEEVIFSEKVTFEPSTERQKASTVWNSRGREFYAVRINTFDQNWLQVTLAPQCLWFEIHK